MFHEAKVNRDLSCTDVNTINEWIYQNLRLVRLHDFYWINEHRRYTWYFHELKDAVRFKLVWG